jgi:hypothetical protein
MAELLNLCPEAVDICISRGDTTPWTFTIKDAVTGDPIDITGFSYILTVDPQENPVDALQNLFALTGTLTFPLVGIVQFAMTPSEADQTPAEYFFDLQQTDGSGAIRSVAKGMFEFKQDITK